MYQSPINKRDINPRQNASICSMITFFFTFNIFKKGFKKELEEKDIYEILKDFRSSNLGDKFEAEWKKEELEKHPSLSRLIWRTYGKRYILCGIIRLVMKSYFTFVNPLCVGKLVSYFSSTRNDISSYEAYFYGLLLVLSLGLILTVHHNYKFFVVQLAQKTKIAFCSVMYRKILKLSSSSVTDITIGKFVTLMTKDVMVFDRVVHYTNDIWVGVIQIFFVTYVLYRQIGSATFAGIGFLLALFPIQMVLAKMAIKTKLKALSKSDERLRIIQEVLSMIQIIKMYTWENYFSGLVNYIRKKEIGKIKLLYYLKVCTLAIGHVSTKISFFICIMIYSQLYGNITAEKVFVVLTCYGTIDDVLNSAVPNGIMQIAETKSALKRIKKLLLSKEVSDISNEFEDRSCIPKIEVNNLTAGISKNKPIIKNLNLNISTGLYAITGGIGSGKSTFLKVFLEELLTTSGSFKVNGKVSYASQDPWLFPGSIRQNILFGLPYDSNRYQTVINICSLQADLDTFCKRDFTLVSDRGLNLSKGQQTRINLARAIYRNADIYLLDSPLAALDATVSNQIFNKCIKDFLVQKLCILITHEIQFLMEVDKIVVMKDGEIEAQGTYEELERRGVSYRTDYIEGQAKEKPADILETITQESGEEVDEVCTLLKQSNDVDATQLYFEIKKEGKVDFHVYKTYFNCAGGFKTVPFLLLLLIGSQASSSGFDYFMSYWSDIEEKFSLLTSNATNTTDYQDIVKVKSNMPLYYSALITATTLLTFGGSFFLVIIMAWANMKLHNIAFSRMIKARMTFFDTYLTGNILNRFSKDIHVLDESIPFLVLQCLKILFFLFGVCFVMTAMKIEFIFITLAFLALLYILRSLYLPTSRSLKRLDGVTRSPVIGHLNTSLEGILTIRASGVEDILKLQFDRHQDLQSSAAYMCLATNRAFGLWLDLLSVMYCGLLILGFFIFPGSTSGNVGLVLSQSLGLADILQFGIRQWAELENQMTSVERILEYSVLEVESTHGKKPSNWPKEGKLSYKNVHLRYPKSRKLVLKNVSFAAKPQQKIGIIGRTGAGKTSLVASLFRLYDTEVGSITVDNYDIKEINLEHLRSNMSIIPQVPTLFSGTLRCNLDPKSQYSDNDLWRALEQVEMKTVVSNLNSKLDFQMKEGGAIFSTGQKQLVCLARAILNKNKIIVLDEATANIDPDTDALIQKTIKRNFSECTILIIAHRLNSVLSSDKVMVISNGSISEFDEPNNLLNNRESAFYYLVSQSGLFKR